MATRKYRVTVRGTDTVMKLSDTDLQAYPGAEPVDEPSQGAAEPATPERKARTASNKARSSASSKTK